MYTKDATRFGFAIAITGWLGEGLEIYSSTSIPQVRYDIVQSVDPLHRRVEACESSGIQIRYRRLIRQTRRYREN